MKQKSELDRRAARELGMSAKDVSRVTAEFITQMVNMLDEAGFVTVDGFGHFKVCEIRPMNVKRKLTSGKFKKGERGGTRTVVVPPYIRVSFFQSVGLKKRLRKNLKE